MRFGGCAQHSLGGKSQEVQDEMCCQCANNCEGATNKSSDAGPPTRMVNSTGHLVRFSFRPLLQYATPQAHTKNKYISCPPEREANHKTPGTKHRKSNLNADTHVRGLQDTTERTCRVLRRFLAFAAPLKTLNKHVHGLCPQFGEALFGSRPPNHPSRGFWLKAVSMRPSQKVSCDATPFRRHEKKTFV